MEQTWNDLLFAHWPLSPDVLRPLVPPELKLDIRDGQCWIAVTPFHMTEVRPRFVPSLPGVSAFPELNVRTYVIHGSKPGVFFFSLDAASRLAVWAARATYRLPYFFSVMNVQDTDGWIHYRSSREKQLAELRGHYRPIRPAEPRKPGSLDHWLSERYCLYTVRRGIVYRAEIHHVQWPLQDAEADLAINSMAAAAGIELPRVPPLLHFSRRLEVLVWPLEKASEQL